MKKFFQVFEFIENILLILISKFIVFIIDIHQSTGEFVWFCDTYKGVVGNARICCSYKLNHYELEIHRFK